MRIGTRGSALALWQARTVAARLEAAGHAIKIVTIRTSGDEGSRADEGGRAAPLKRLFVKEIEDALLCGDIDIAVHSAKDMSAVLPEGLEIAAVLPREDPLDALVLPSGGTPAAFDEIAAGIGYTAVIGTSSVRRRAQLAGVLTGATFLPVRGNVDTRLRKLDEGAYGALVLAAAGLRRLGLGGRISATIPIAHCVPAPGQGIVAIEIRAIDRRTRDALTPIDDRAAAIALAAERAVVRALGGGCQLPLGAIALHEGGALHMHGVIASTDGRRIIRREARGPSGDAAALGESLAGELATGGGSAILDEVRGGAE